MNEIINLPASTGTALALIASGVIVPAVTSLMKYPEMPKWLKRVIPIVLAALAAVLIVILQGGGDLADKLTTWILVAATVVGIAQTVYSLMPGAWKGLEEATSKEATSKVVEDEIPPSGLAEDERWARERAKMFRGHRMPLLPVRGAMGTYSTLHSTPDDPEPETKSKDDARE